MSGRFRTGFVPLLAFPLLTSCPPAPAAAVSRSPEAFTSDLSTLAASLGAPRASGVTPWGELHEQVEAASDWMPGSVAGPVEVVRQPRLVATHRFTHVHERPSFDSAKIGYLRAGAAVVRGEEPHRFADCAKGFYRVHPRGYVCVGRAASLDEDHVLATAAARRPDREATMPYEYGRAELAVPHVYHRVPTAGEQRATEPDLAYQLRQGPKSWEQTPSGPLPAFLEAGLPSLRMDGKLRSGLVLHSGKALFGTGFALLDTFEAEGRRFALTTDLSIVPLDRLERVEPSAFRGLPLDDTTTLPVAFVRSHRAHLYSGDFTEQGLTLERRLEFREAIAITEEKKRFNGKVYLRTTGGSWLHDTGVTIVRENASPPHWARQGRKWIDVSIVDQSLVAYEGTRPVFVTLVSTGIGGTGAEEDRATRQGQFRIHTKHVSITMSSDEQGDEYDLRDVPYVQYFSDGYALHASYWHDAFGTPRSHGCVNLSPLDARWMFDWTDPEVPAEWHGALSLVGTFINVRP